MTNGMWKKTIKETLNQLNAFDKNIEVLKREMASEKKQGKFIMTEKGDLFEGFLVELELSTEYVALIKANLEAMKEYL